MAIKTLKDYQPEVQQIQKALRIGATHEEYLACVRSLNQPVRFECPLGEAVDTLAGFAMVWRWKGLLKPEPIVASDKFNAQGLEGKVSIPCDLLHGPVLCDASQPLQSSDSQLGRNALRGVATSSVA